MSKKHVNVHVNLKHVKIRVAKTTRDPTRPSGLGRVVGSLGLQNPDWVGIMRVKSRPDPTRCALYRFLGHLVVQRTNEYG